MVAHFTAPLVGDLSLYAHATTVTTTGYHVTEDEVYI
jgi:hypothetical protein